MDRENIQNFDNLKKAIVEAIAFFDIFDYPLTPFEIWMHISIKCELSDVLKCLENENIGLQSSQGFYFLNDRHETVNIRKKKNNYAHAKVKKAMKISRIFKFIPWIKMVAVGNIIGAHNLKKESDIDLFIVTEKNRAWVTRFFCVGIVKALGLRPKKNNARDKICLSFFLDEKNLDLKNYMLSEETETQSLNDFYFIYWMAGLMPIYNKDEIYEKFIEENVWLKNFMPNWEKTKLASLREIKPLNSRVYFKALDLCLGGTDQRLMEYQLKIMPLEAKEILNKDTRAVATKNVIKLHINDRRQEYLEKYKRNLK